MLNREIGQRYLLKGRLGQGAHGQVFRAWDSVRGGYVALKLFRDDAMDVQTAEASRQFGVADGSAILPLLEVHPEYAEGQVTVMRLMEGTLAEHIPASVSQAVHYTRRILTGLEFCHGRDVLHGDVKPSNVFLDSGRAVLLGDFGVAGLTIEYAAPELVAGRPRSAATDLWAASTTFYELVCGEPPFGQVPDFTEVEIAERISAGSYAHPDDKLPYLPLRFRQFFRSCFVPDPSERPWTTAAAMRGALRELAVRVEWVRIGREGCIACFEGYELHADGTRTGTTYEALITHRPRVDHYVAEIKKAAVGGRLRRLRGLQPFAGSKPQTGQKLSVWMRRLTEQGAIAR